MPDKQEIWAKERVFLAASQLISKQDDSADFAEDFQRSLTRILAAEWTDFADRAVKGGIAAFKRRRSQTKGTVSAVQKSVERVMRGFGSEVEGVLKEQLETFYGEVTQRFVEEFDLKGVQKATVGELGFNLTQRDEDAINVIQKIAVQSAGRYFPESVTAKTAEVIERVVLNEGLSVKEAAVKLEAELRGALGATGFDDAVPKQFRNNPQSYFGIVANNASVTASNVGRVIAMADADIERYEIRVIHDKRTSQICTDLDGRVFTVSTTMGAVEKFLSAKGLEDVEELMPFNKSDSVPKWADDGLGFPPYHHKCRSTVVPA